MITRIWDETDPADADEAKYGAQEMREIKGDLREILTGYIKGLEVSRKDDDEVYISGGAIHVYNGATHQFLCATSQITKSIAGHGQTDVPIYFYVDDPASAGTLAAADIEYSTTAPTYSHTYNGWYHPTTTDWRFIGSIPVDNSGDLIAGYRSENGNLYFFDDYESLLVGGSATSFTDITNIEDCTPHIDNALAILRASLLADAGAHRLAYVRKNGSSATNGMIAVTAAASTYGCSIFRVPVDSNGKAEYKVSNASAQVSFYSYGYWEPR